MTAASPGAARRSRPRPREGPVLVWLTPLALMGVIWFFSSQPDLSSGLGLADLVGRKVIHALEYGLLCLLWWRALRTQLAPTTALAVALALTVGYGAIDEYHQTFTEGRNGSPIDVAIDATGATIATVLIRRRESRRTAPRGARA